MNIVKLNKGFILTYLSVKPSHFLYNVDYITLLTIQISNKNIEMESVTYCTIKLSVCKQLVAMGTKTISLFRFHQCLFGDEIL